MWYILKKLKVKNSDQEVIKVNFLLHILVTINSNIRVKVHNTVELGYREHLPASKIYSYNLEKE